jgi:multiple antibiotic resistance protein
MQAFDIAIFLHFFVGLIATVNPVGIMPVFVSLTGSMSPDVLGFEISNLNKCKLYQ